MRIKNYILFCEGEEYNIQRIRSVVERSLRMYQFCVDHGIKMSSDSILRYLSTLLNDYYLDTSKSIDNESIEWVIKMITDRFLSLNDISQRMYFGDVLTDLEKYTNVNIHENIDEIQHIAEEMAEDSPFNTELISVKPYFSIPKVTARTRFVIKIELVKNFNMDDMDTHIKKYQGILSDFDCYIYDVEYLFSKDDLMITLVQTKDQSEIDMIVKGTSL